MLVYHNQREFKKDKYGIERIEHKAVLSSSRVVEKGAFFTEFFVNKQELIDEVSLV